MTLEEAIAGFRGESGMDSIIDTTNVGRRCWKQPAPWQPPVVR